MKFLATLWDGGGSVPAELAIVRKLVSRGHEVLVLAPLPLRAAVESAGASFRAWQNVPQRRRIEDPDPFCDAGLSGPQVVQLLLDNLVAGPSRAYASEVGAVLRERAPDALISSMLLLGAMVAAEAHALPFAAMVPNCYLMPSPGMPPFGFGWQPARTWLGRARIEVMNRLAIGLWDRGLHALNATRAQLRLPVLAHLFDQHNAATRVLTLSARAFDFHAKLPANVRYVGPQLDDPSWAQDVALPEGDEPLVLVSMSTTHMDQTPVLRRVVGALARLPVRGLVTVGPEVDPALIAGTTRVRVARSAAHAAVLPLASAVVSHGGHGTVIKALAAGLPQLVLPLGRDQPNNAARVKASGTGLVLRPGATQAAIAAAVQCLLVDKQLKLRAAELGARVREEAAGGEAVHELEQIAARRGQGYGGAVSY